MRNQLDEILQKALRIDETPDPSLIQNVINNLPEPAARKSAGKHPLRVALIAAILAAFSLTAAFAYGGTVWRFMFGKSSAARVEEIDGGEGVIQYAVTNRELPANRTDYGGHIRFDTVEEANQFAPFTIKSPQYLPENMELSHVSVQQYTDGTAGYDAIVHYWVKTPNSTYGLGIFQYYAGPDGYIDLLTIYPVEKVMVGGIEASLVDAEGSYHLYWVKDGVAYEMTNRFYGIETLVAIAESV
jgi:hypothetical protein